MMKNEYILLRHDYNLNVKINEQLPPDIKLMPRVFFFNELYEFCREENNPDNFMLTDPSHVEIFNSILNKRNIEYLVSEYTGNTFYSYAEAYMYIGILDKKLIRQDITYLIAN